MSICHTSRESGSLIGDATRYGPIDPEDIQRWSIESAKVVDTETIEVIWHGTGRRPVDGLVVFRQMHTEAGSDLDDRRVVVDGFSVGAYRRDGRRINFDFRSPSV